VRTPRETRTERARAARPKPAGGKALQRLLQYLLERDPAMIEAVVPVAVPASAEPPVAQARDALRASRARRKTPRGARARALPTAARPAAARAFASKIAKAARSVTASQPRTRRGKARTAGRAAPRGLPRGITSVNPATWTDIGPALIPDGQTYGTNRVDVAGRVSTVAADPTDARHLLCASANGGIWESTDGGATWAARTDHMPTLAVGAITFDPHDARRVYAGSGEGNAYKNLGAGVYLSTDGGTTWKVLTGAPFIGSGFYDLVVDPVNRRVLYAATTSGFYVSTNAGAAWTRRRAAECWDISVHPNGGTVELLIACADGLWRSINAGTSFAPVVLPGVLALDWNRLAVDRVTSAPDVAYAFGARSNNRAYLWRRVGSTWSRVALPADLQVHQAWYDWYVAASPTSRTQVFLGAIDIHRGTLTGLTWTWKNISSQGGNSIHPDQHALTFAPGDSRTIYAGNDGGVYRSTNSGNTWTALNRGLGIAEIEYLASDPAAWQWLLAGTQDNGTLRFTGSSTWDHVADGDGGDCGVNQLNPTEVYHSYYDVSLERSNNKGDTWADLDPPAVRSLFYPPVEVSGRTVAIGGQSLVMTRTGARPWTTVGIGLPADEVASVMRAVDANTFLVGTTRGRLLRVAWNGTAWSATPLNSPATRWMSAIAIDPANPLRIWITFSQLGGGGVFRSDDAGTTWVNCSRGLPPIPFNSIVVDPGNFRRVWTAADVGVYQSTDLGASWSAFSAGLPNAMAVDLLFHRQDRVLLCATRNRGVWAIQVP
jgi:photosystem II stability/assembly factor-like uncharacterized protein